MYEQAACAYPSTCPNIGAPLWNLLFHSCHMYKGLHRKISPQIPVLLKTQYKSIVGTQTASDNLNRVLTPLYTIQML